jgi:hypothetical protein
LDELCREIYFQKCVQIGPWAINVQKIGWQNKGYLLNSKTFFFLFSASATPSDKDEDKKTTNATASGKHVETPPGPAPKIRTRLSTGTLVMNGTSTAPLKDKSDVKTPSASASENATPAKPAKDSAAKPNKGESFGKSAYGFY